MVAVTVQRPPRRGQSPGLPISFQTQPVENILEYPVGPGERHGHLIIPDQGSLSLPNTLGGCYESESRLPIDIADDQLQASGSFNLALCKLSTEAATTSIASLSHSSQDKSQQEM